MLHISKQGVVLDKRVTNSIVPSLGHGPMNSVEGIIVHQTGGSTASSAIQSFKAKKEGTHFIIEKDGTIYQTASVHERTEHVGKIRSRCMVEGTCSARERKLNSRFNPQATHMREMRKQVPERFPSNKDSIGIELVGEAFPTGPRKKMVYEQVTEEQNKSLKWLIDELCMSLSVDYTEIYRHPVISYKTDTEAGTAQW